MAKMICFDMDGTIADLYGVTGWLESILAEETTPYINAAPLVDMNRLKNLCYLLITAGWEIRIISWLSKDSSKFYKRAVREAKLWWLEQFDLPLDHIHLVEYGTTKANCVRRAVAGERAILIDDDEKVRNGWHLGDTIDATNPNWLDELEALL